MSPRILPLPYRKLARILHREGFRRVDQEGSHVLWHHPDGRRVVVPRHDGRDLSVGLVQAILQEAGLDPAKYRR